MNLTTTQNNAVKARCEDMIVSAGAGSGKTTVLTRRLIERIKAGDSVTDFLVVTFMNSAAADMRRKLYDALIEESALDPANRHLQRQIYLVGEANICTISSYCLSLVRENFAALGISPRARVIDETEKTMLLRRTADSLVGDMYESGDKGFLLLVNSFSGDKDDSPLIERAVSVYDKLRAMTDPSGLLESCADGLKKDSAETARNGFFACETGKRIKKIIEKRLDGLVERSNELFAFAASNAESDKYLAPVAKLDDLICGVRAASAKGYAHFREAITQACSGIPVLYSRDCPESARKYVSDEKKSIVDSLRKLKSRYCRGGDEYISESFSVCAETVRALRDFLIKLDSRYETVKRDSGLLDYTDFERKALSLLEVKGENGESVPSELCLRKRAMFKEVLIDEYQDVNPMQDRIFTLLSGTRSRFMVGDVKQSIYRFRNAYPDIFLGYKEEYPDYSRSGTGGRARILLRENFRCSQCVIDFVNYLFDNITKGSPFRPEYDGEWLIHASERPERAHPVTVAVAQKEPKLSAEARRDEAEYIAREINRLVSEEYGDDGERIGYGDIAVMLGAMKGFSIPYEKAFRKYGVPYKSQSTENFLENPVVSLAVSAMRAVDDPTDDIALCALMRSPVCNFTSGDLFRIRTRRKDSNFWGAVTAASLPARKKSPRGKFVFTSRPGEKSLCGRCRDFVRRLAAWRHSADGVPCGEFLKGFFVDTGLLKIADSESRRKSLLLIYEYARRYESGAYRGLSGFLDYLKELEAGGRSIADAAPEGGENAVSFITVHKSKGLEYKVCFLAGADKRFRFEDPRDGVTLLRRRGVFFKIKDRTALTSYDPLCNVLARDIERDMAFGEELRKLYVALTRAKERLYVTGAADEKRLESPPAPDSARSWLDLVLYTSALGEKAFFDLRHIPKATGETGFIPAPARRSVRPTPEMLSAAEYVYPFGRSAETARKISVSELREGLLDDDEYDRSLITVPASRVGYKPAFAAEYAATAADKGTANHLFMQFCDFGKVEKNGVAAEADRLLKINMITPEQRGMIDETSLARFFESALYKEMRASKQLRREMRFSVRDDIFGGGESVLVQGVIDCFFENPDGSYTVVDYKTDRVFDPAALAARHRVQLGCYCRAVESMTGKKVTRALLYSFAMGKEVPL